MLLTLKLSSVCSKTWKKQKLILYKMWHNFSINSTSGPKEPGFYCTTLGNHFVIFQTQCNKLYLSRSCSFKENFFGWPYNTVHFRSNERPFCYFKEEIQRYMYHLFFPIFKLKDEVCFFFQKWNNEALGITQKDESLGSFHWPDTRENISCGWLGRVSNGNKLLGKRTNRPTK